MCSLTKQEKIKVKTNVVKNFISVWGRGGGGKVITDIYLAYHILKGSSVSQITSD